jgi:adenosylcobyric acid synthase
VFGVCGGYQMLGERISDPLGVESPESITTGLGLLPGVTTFEENKTTTQVKARILVDKGLLRGLKDSKVNGYEIHMGQTDYGSAERLMEIIESYHGQANAPDGAVNQSGLVFGTYLHGIFHNEEFTRRLLNNLRELRGKASEISLSLDKEKQYNALAEIVRQNLNIPEVYKILTSSS